MGARRSLVSVLSVPLIAVALAATIFLPTFSYNYISPQTFTYQVAIMRGTNTTLTITNHTILLTIAYNESYGSASGTLMKDFFIGSSGKVYVSFVPTFCEVKPVPIPLDRAAPSAPIEPAMTTLGVSHLFILPPSPPPPPPPPPLPPVQKSVGSINLTISFIPLTSTSGPVNVTVPLLPCAPSASSAALLPGFYNVTVKFVWLLVGEFYGLNGTLNISVAHINVITPLPEFP